MASREKGCCTGILPWKSCDTVPRKVPYTVVSCTFSNWLLYITLYSLFRNSYIYQLLFWNVYIASLFVYYIECIHTVSEQWIVYTVRYVKNFTPYMTEEAQLQA